MGIKEKFSLSGHKALITGASQGIGSALAIALAEFGADVVIHCRSEVEKANSIAEQSRAYGVKAEVIVCDLSENNVHEKLYQLATEAIGSIDILILNASIQVRKKWFEITPEEFDNQIQVNLKNSLFTIQLFSKYMIEKQWGRIITFGSVQQQQPHVDMLVYAASKSGQENMMRNIAKQVACFGVTVNNIQAGVFDTVRNKEVLENAEYKSLVVSKIPVRFIAEPEDCAGIVNLLCSDAGRFITGANIAIDGGMSIN